MTCKHEGIGFLYDAQKRIAACPDCNKTVFDILTQLPESHGADKPEEVSANPWTSVEDDLPKKTGQYYCYLWDVESEELFYGAEWFEKRTNTPSFWSSEGENETVLWWQHPPAPPIKGKYLRATVKGNNDE